MNSKQASHFTTGLLLVAVGLILLASEQFGWRVGFWRLWPVVFLVLGVGSLMRGAEDGRYGGGAWFLLLGVIFFLHTFRVLTLGHSWPLFIVAAGASMLFGGSEDGRRAPKTPAGSVSERRQ